jgi:hypothetical protein
LYIFFDKHAFQMKTRALASEAKWVGEAPNGILRAQEVVAAGQRFIPSGN